MDLLIQNKHKMILSRCMFVFENNLHYVRYAQCLRKYRQNYLNFLVLLTE